jgi:hypothetical protein
MPARDATITSWIGKDRMRVEQGRNVIIIRLDRKKMYVVEPGGATYSVIDLPIDLKKLLPPGIGDQMLQMMKMNVTATKTGETKKVGRWKAVRWNIDLSSPMAKVHQVWWVTKDVKVDLSSFARMAETMLELQPGMAQAAKTLSRIDGFPVAKDTVTQMGMGGGAKMTSHEEVVAITEGTPPAGAYEPPANAKAKPFNMMEMMKKGR